MVYYPGLPYSHRETCPHWIDYEILDALPDHLKSKYIDQFWPPRFCMAHKGGKWVPRLECLANHHDEMCKNICDCSEHYPQTLKEMSEQFKETLCYKEGVYVCEMDTKSH